MHARLLALCVFIVGLDVVAIRPRYADLGRTSLAFGALFALTPLRNIQVGVPPPMIAIDMWSFFWCMVLVAAGAACSATAHFAYAEGTPWTPRDDDGGGGGGEGGGGSAPTGVSAESRGKR